MSKQLNAGPCGLRCALELVHSDAERRFLERRLAELAAGDRERSP